VRNSNADRSKPVISLSESKILGGDYLVDLSVKCVEVDKGIDAGCCKGLHTSIVILRGVYMVYTNSICAQCLHERDIEVALVSIGQRISR
jgi:hypothetical protein